MPSILIVGGLTIDRFPDGSTAPGGSVIHSGRAAAAEGADVALLTVAGDEPEARDGIAQLRSLGVVDIQPSPATTVYGHHEHDGRRVLTYERASEAIDPVAATTRAADVALFAPIAHELDVGAVSALARNTGARTTVVLAQGWLRHLRLGEPVRAMSLEEVPAETWRALGATDAVVVSTEDFVAPTEDPFAQAALLRGRLGRRPLLVLTMAAEGHLLDDPGADRVVASVPRAVVSGVPTVGAGDTFGAALAVGLAAAAIPSAAAASAAERVVAVLESRRIDR
jgi:sugar/nucleoside kinase (ribokinase family)